MFRSSLLYSVLVCAAALFAPSTASAQMKVGVVNLQRAISETAEIKKAQNEMELRYKPRQEQLDKLQRELNDIQTQLQGAQGKLSAAGEADLEARGQQKQRQAQRITEDLQADVDRDRQDILERAGRGMQEVLKKLAEEKGLDMIVDSTTTLFFKPTLELTTEAIAAYDKAHPAK